MDISEKFTKAPQLLLQRRESKIKLSFTKLRFSGECLSRRQLIFQDLLFSKLLSGSMKTLNPTYILLHTTYLIINKRCKKLHPTSLNEKWKIVLNNFPFSTFIFPLKKRCNFYTIKYVYSISI